ncbi:MAG: hypothetical protein CM15mP100_2070 [Alphaproteobacteria bacterium]|nr:MAG: hypothetical protein CM15mP100_2070 [Alphaproteobacteria bacterium]
MKKYADQKSDTVSAHQTIWTAKGQADRVSCFYKTFHSRDYLIETLFFQVLKEKSVFACTSCVNQPINTKGKNTLVLEGMSIGYFYRFDMNLAERKTEQPPVRRWINC